MVVNLYRVKGENLTPLICKRCLFVKVLGNMQYLYNFSQNFVVAIYLI